MLFVSGDGRVLRGGGEGGCRNMFCGKVRVGGGRGTP